MVKISISLDNKIRKAKKIYVSALSGGLNRDEAVMVAVNEMKEHRYTIISYLFKSECVGPNREINTSQFVPLNLYIRSIEPHPCALCKHCTIVYDDLYQKFRYRCIPCGNTDYFKDEASVIKKIFLMRYCGIWEPEKIDFHNSDW